jgi:hypothetical protein
VDELEENKMSTTEPENRKVADKQLITTVKPRLRGKMRKKIYSVNKSLGELTSIFLGEYKSLGEC